MTDAKQSFGDSALVSGEMTPGMVRLLVDLGWLREVRATADGSVVEHVLTTTGIKALERSNQGLS
jgi:hypothetical protein